MRPPSSQCADVVGVQTAGRPAPGHHAAAVTVLQHPPQPPTDLAGGPPGPDDLPVTVKPDLTVRLARQVPAVTVGQHRAEMQCRGAALDVQVHDHGGVLPMRAPRDIGVPPGVDQADEAVHGSGKWGHLHRGVVVAVTVVDVGVAAVAAVAVVTFPVGDQRVLMRLHGGVELRRLHLGQGDPVGGVHRVDDLGERPLGPRCGLRLGTRLLLDRGAQLRHRRRCGRLRVVLVGPVGGVCGDHADLIQRQPALPHLRRQTGKRLEPPRHGDHRLGVVRRDPGLPCHQPGDRPRTGHPSQLPALELGDDLHQPTIDRVALPGQLGHLVEQHPEPLLRSQTRCGRGHDTIQAPGSDKSGRCGPRHLGPCE